MPKKRDQKEHEQKTEETPIDLRKRISTHHQLHLHKIFHNKKLRLHPEETKLKKALQFSKLVHHISHGSLTLPVCLTFNRKKGS